MIFFHKGYLLQQISNDTNKACLLQYHLDEADIHLFLPCHSNTARGVFHSIFLCHPDSWLRDTTEGSLLSKLHRRGVLINKENKIPEDVRSRYDLEVARSRLCAEWIQNFIQRGHENLWHIILMVCLLSVSLDGSDWISRHNEVGYSL